MDDPDGRVNGIFIAVLAAVTPRNYPTHSLRVSIVSHPRGKVGRLRFSSRDVLCRDRGRPGVRSGRFSRLVAMILRDGLIYFFVVFAANLCVLELLQMTWR